MEPPPRARSSRSAFQRDDLRKSPSRPVSESSSYNDSQDASGGGDAVANHSGPSRDSQRKLDQIIQNFHTKAAIVILQGRMSLPGMLLRDGTPKVNKWFQIETDDTEAFKDELMTWKTCGGFENRPPPMIIETYLDTTDLTNKQSLVIVDGLGKRWDVAEALNSSPGSNDDGSRHRKHQTEVILERWMIQLGPYEENELYDFGAILPTIYKKNIVFFRSLYATTKLVPAWKFAKALAKSSPSNLRVNCRITSGSNYASTRHDPLTVPLYDGGGPVVSMHSLGETDSPAGRFTAELTYRNDCNFRVDDSEALLSSRFMGADDNYFQPSLGSKPGFRRENSRGIEIGSLPAHRQHTDDTEPGQAYGSMSTFHGNAAPMAASPMSALRALKPVGSETSSPPTGSSLRSRPMQAARPSATARALEGINTARRPSLSFQPFKAGSLSSSPGPGTPIPHGGEMLPPQSPHSLSRNSLTGISALSQARNRSSLTAGMPASLRGIPILQEHIASSSGSSSPKPAPISRYSSSFSHRRNRMSYGGASKIEDDQGSSGKQSLSSSAAAQPGSGVLAEVGTGGSSGSLPQTDEDNISDFLKLLDSKKTLQSFEIRGEAAAARTNAQLSRFKSMQESNAALTESFSSSAMLQRSSSASSRQLSSVPPMVAATSVSTSSSPGKPVSPHTPHTPAIPSRLSANSVVEYSQPQRPSYRSRTMPQNSTDDAGAVNEAGTNAIDIPTSPRPFQPYARRSSSVSQQQRSMAIDEDAGDGPYGPHRSISLGDTDREAPSLSALLGQDQSSTTVEIENQRDRVLQPAAHLDESPTALTRQIEQSQQRDSGPTPSRSLVSGSANVLYRPRIGRVGGRGLTPPQGGSYASLGERASGSGSLDRPGSRFSFSRPGGASEMDDEPLLFDMSELGRDQGRRSLEEARGRGNLAGSSNERGGYESSRGGDSGSSSRRGSRRGW